MAQMSFLLVIGAMIYAEAGASGSHNFASVDAKHRFASFSGKSDSAVHALEASKTRRAGCADRSSHCRGLLNEAVEEHPGTPIACVDIFSGCGALARSGQCTTNSSRMRIECAFSCRLCPPRTHLSCPLLRSTPALDPIEAERNTLRLFFNLTGGPYWHNADYWCTNISHCQWHGVECSQVTGRVTGLQLQRNFLVAKSLPAVLRQLSRLQSLNIGGNEIAGTIPPELAQLPLTQLHMEDNMLTGTLPSVIGNCSSLEMLSLYENTLSGTLPPSLGKLTQLKYLWLGGNSFSGSIPASMLKPGNLRRLEHFHVNNNHISGTIPPEFSHLSQLMMIQIATNRISGTIPKQLGQLSLLTWAYIQDNALTGTIPAQIMGNPGSRLLVLAAHNNSLTGTIPASICNVRSLQYLGLTQNALTGTLPACIGNLSNLSKIELSNNALSGAIPEGIGMLRNMEHLDLDRNTLSGTIPNEIGLLRTLKFVHLNENMLTGTLPSVIVNCSSLEVLSLYQNSLSGTLPPSLGKLTQLKYLWLGGNFFSGNIPSQLGQLPQLSELWLDRNRLSGSIPLSIGQLRGLQKLMLNMNQLSGEIPASISNLTNLTSFVASHNAISGSIPVSLPSSLHHVVLHSNSLRGNLPSFRAFKSLKTLTLFQQQLYGRLVLPHDAPGLSIVMVYGNRLSCQVEANYEMADGNSNSPAGYKADLSQARNLLGPGNSFSEPAVPWAATSSVSILWSKETFFQEWKGNILILVLGLVLLGTILAAKGELNQKFYVFNPQRGMEAMLAWCCRMVAAWNLIFFVALIILYYVGSNYYECGQASLNITIAYLADAAVIEWCVAVAATVFAFVCTSSLVLFRRKAHLEYLERKRGRVRAVTAFKVCVAWLPFLVVFSAFPALYAMSSNVPGKNVLGISTNILEGIANSVGVIMYGINAVLTPFVVIRIVKAIHGDNNDAEVVSEFGSQVVMFSRLFLVLIVPAVVTIWVNQDCYRGWLQLWSTCQSSHNFDLDILVTSPGMASGAAQVPNPFDKYANVSSIPGATVHAAAIPITRHKDICSTGYSSGRCSRAVVGTLGHLVVSKLFFTAFMSPVLALAIQTHLMRALVRATKNILTCKAWWTERPDVIDISVEIASITMLLEYCLVLGFAVPAILPLTLVTFVLHQCVFHRARQHGFTFEMDAQPSSVYLAFSLCLGCALLVWFFWENNLHGKELVAIGVPVMMLLPMVLLVVWPVSGPPWSWLVPQDHFTIDVQLAPAAILARGGLVYRDSRPEGAAVPSMGDASAQAGARHVLQI